MNALKLKTQDVLDSWRVGCVIILDASWPVVGGSRVHRFTEPESERNRQRRQIERALVVSTYLVR